MSIFTGMFRSRDKPQNRTAGSSYSFFFGGSTSGKAVTERTAMQMTAVYSCVRILAEAVVLALHKADCHLRDDRLRHLLHLCICLAAKWIHPSMYGKPQLMGFG